MTVRPYENVMPIQIVSSMGRRSLRWNSEFGYNWGRLSDI
jgi:hypothetical protein